MNLQIPFLNALRKALPGKSSSSRAATDALPPYRQATSDQVILSGPPVNPEYQAWLKTQQKEWNNAVKNGKTTLEFNQWLQEKETLKEFETALLESLESELEANASMPAHS